MAVVLDSTVGGANANSYPSLVEARAFYDTQPYFVDSAATPINDDTKLTQFLVWATRLLGEHMKYEGTVSASTQSLLFPRYGVQKPNGYFYDQGVIPNELKNATAAWAYYLMKTDRTEDNDLATQGITMLKAGSIELAFENPSAKVMPDAVFAMIRHLGYQTADVGVAKVHRT